MERVGQMCFVSVVRGRRASCKEEKGSRNGECEIMTFSGFLVESIFAFYCGEGNGYKRKGLRSESKVGGKKG